MNRECQECTTLYAPDLPRCPHCGAENTGDDVPKTTLHGGSSHAGVDSPAQGLTAQETSDSAVYEYVRPTQPDTEVEVGNTDSDVEGDVSRVEGTDGEPKAPGTDTAGTAVNRGEPVVIEKADE